MVILVTAKCALQSKCALTMHVPAMRLVQRLALAVPLAHAMKDSGAMAKHAMLLITALPTAVAMGMLPAYKLGLVAVAPATLITRAMGSTVTKSISAPSRMGTVTSMQIANALVWVRSIVLASLASRELVKRVIACQSTLVCPTGQPFVMQMPSAPILVPTSTRVPANLLFLVMERTAVYLLISAKILQMVDADPMLSVLIKLGNPGDVHASHTMQVMP